MAIVRVVEVSITVNNRPIQDYAHLDDHILPTYYMSPWLTWFAVLLFINI